jgi:hypothetical protein
MRLEKAQKDAVLAWIAEGLQTDEINERAAEFDPPFHVSRQQVDYYRKSRKIDIEAITQSDEGDALRAGLALRSERVKKLKRIAALIEGDLFGGRLWLRQEKGIGSGDKAKIVEYEEFNKAGVDAYRGLLDDIARETGGRKESPGVEVNIFDLDEWKKRRRERLEKVTAMNGGTE